jgi:hypothetical protein
MRITFRRAFTVLATLGSIFIVTPKVWAQG